MRSEHFAPTYLFYQKNIFKGVQIYEQKESLKFDFLNTCGKIKAINAVNNGPAGSKVRGTGNFAAYEALEIPYARNHDASFHSGYGGEHSVDISAIFPDFTANPYVPESYDFACTDEYILGALHDAGGRDVKMRPGGLRNRL